MKVIWPCNATDVNILLSQFNWHCKDENTWQCPALEKVLTQLQQRETDYMSLKINIKLPFMVQSKFKYEF